MMPKHTPGPWKRSEDDPYTIIGPDMMEVAHIAYSCMVIKSEPDYSEMEGNAIIVEAGPEMLKLLKSIIELADNKTSVRLEGGQIGSELVLEIKSLVSRIEQARR